MWLDDHIQDILECCANALAYADLIEPGQTVLTESVLESTSMSVAPASVGPAHQESIARACARCVFFFGGGWSTR